MPFKTLKVRMSPNSFCSSGSSSSSIFDLRSLTKEDLAYVTGKHVAMLRDDSVREVEYAWETNEDIRSELIASDRRLERIERWVDTTTEEPEWCPVLSEDEQVLNPMPGQANDAVDDCFESDGSSDAGVEAEAEREVEQMKDLLDMDFFHEVIEEMGEQEYEEDDGNDSYLADDEDDKTEAYDEEEYLDYPSEDELEHVDDFYSPLE